MVKERKENVKIEDNLRKKSIIIGYLVPQKVRKTSLPLIFKLKSAKVVYVLKDENIS